MSFRSILFGVCLACSPLQGFEPFQTNFSYRDDGNIRVIPVSPTPEPETVILKIIFPRSYENKRKTPVNIQLRLKGYPLGTMSRFDRASELYNNPEGQGIHVFIDDNHYFIYNQTVEDSFDENHKFSDKILSFPIPFSLEPGQHVLRCFPVRSYGESLKGENCFQEEIFYFQDRTKKDITNFDPDKPYITYNEPQGRYPAHKSNPILLDFYLSNCQLSRDDYKVRLSIDGKIISIFTRWTPYYIYGLKKGSYKVKLELLNKDNQLVPGYFNVAEREIIVE